MGLKINYKLTMDLNYECLEGYRSVTFADISIFNPAFIIDPNIKDEDGITAILESEVN